MGKKEFGQEELNRKKNTKEKKVPTQKKEQASTSRITLGYDVKFRGIDDDDDDGVADEVYDDRA